MSVGYKGEKKILENIARCIEALRPPMQWEEGYWNGQ